MTLRLVTFDLDDTLWDVAPVIDSAEQVLRNWFADNQVLASPPSVDEIHAMRRQLVSQAPALQHRISELRRLTLFHLLQQGGYSQQHAQVLASQAFEVFLEARQQVELFDDVHPTLQVLQHGYILGALSNGNADIGRIGLAQYFRFHLKAEDIGISKPDPQPFLAALKRGGDIAPEHAVHVGDHPRDDITGAQAAGMKAVWYNPQGRPWEGQGRPDGEIQRLAELPELLAQF